MVKFREKILTKWGFLPFYEPNNQGKRQYVHVSGSIFVMIPQKEKHDPHKRVSSTSVAEKTDLTEIYITKHFSGVKQTGDEKQNQIFKVSNVIATVVQSGQ